MAEGYTTGRYWQGSMQQGQAGGYMVNTSHLDQRGLYELPALTLHEAVPGHHLQIALSQELSGLPYFRRNISVTAFTERLGPVLRVPRRGDGHLSRSLRAVRALLIRDVARLSAGRRHGHPLARLGHRAGAALLHRQLRAVPHNIQTELERYISWPGQALAYKVGELRFRQLRREAEQALGERFNIRQFDTLLLGGPLPLDLVQERVRDWIKKSQG